MSRNALIVVPGTTTPEHGRESIKGLGFRV